MWFDVARVFALIIQIPWSFLVRLYLIPTPFIYALRRLKNLKLLIVESFGPDAIPNPGDRFAARLNTAGFSGNPGWSDWS